MAETSAVAEEVSEQATRCDQESATPARGMKGPQDQGPAGLKLMSQDGGSKDAPEGSPTRVKQRPARV